MDELFRFLLRFFQSWRRLIGVWALLAACLFAAGWVRSYFYIDKFICPVGKNHVICSSSVLGLISISVSKPLFEYVGNMPRLDTMRISIVFEPHGSEGDHYLDPVSEFAGLEPLYYGFGFRWDGLIVVFPFWSIIIPLTLFSACLLLSKPHVKSKEPELPS